MEERPRIHGLDQLRGILAFIVMVYHYVWWTKCDLPLVLKLPLDQLGIYAVSTFYVLSGAALFIVYHRRAVDLKFLKDFAVKRTTRIVPLFWLATTLSLLLYVVQHGWLPASKTKLLISYSLVFSWVDPNAYFATGAWSIGNEWAFYTIFPLMLVAYHRSRRCFFLLIGSCVALGFGLAWWFISPCESLAMQWPIYISPLNQLPLFALGVAIGGRILKHGTNNHRSIFVGLASTALFLLLCYSIKTEGASSVSGVYRVLFVAVCVAWCYGSGVLTAKGMLGKAADHLGRISYAVYLLHPIVWAYLNLALPRMGVRSVSPIMVAFGLAIPLTLIASSLSWLLLEKPIMTFGKRIVAGADAEPATAPYSELAARSPQG